MNKELVTRFNAQLSQYEPNILQDLLVKHDMTASQFVQIVTTQVKKSPLMQEAFQNNPSSLFASILLCAELGLSPSEEVGEFYFVPFKGAIKPMLGYKGIVTLFMRTGKVKWISSELVYVDDDFEYELGLEPKLSHIPNDLKPKRSENIFAVYAVAKLDDGEKVFKVMTREEIMAIAQMNGNNNLYFNEKRDPQNWMARKTTLKQLAKLLPKDYYGKRALSLDDTLEGGGYVSLDDNEIIVKQAKSFNKPRGNNLHESFELLDEPLKNEGVYLDNV